MNNTALQDLQERLEHYGFRRFVQHHFDFLHMNTVRHERLGKELVALGVMDESDRKICMERIGNKERNIQFYNMLVAREAHWELLVGLYFSNNNRVLRYIRDKLTAVEAFLPKLGAEALKNSKLFVDEQSLSNSQNSESQSSKLDEKSNVESSLFYWNAIAEENS